jgi:plasmid stability protein
VGVATVFTIRNVPDDVATALKVRAAQSGKSLQAFVLDVLVRESTSPTPTLAEVMSKADAEVTAEVSNTDILDALAASRADR